MLYKLLKIMKNERTESAPNIFGRTDLSTVTVLFFFSAVERIPLNFNKKPRNESLIFEIGKNNCIPTHAPSDWASIFNAKELYNNIKWLFRQYILDDTFSNIEPFKTICALKCLSNQFKKMIIIFCFRGTSNVYNYQCMDVHVDFFSSLIDNKFFISGDGMYENYNVTEQERKKSIYDPTAPNHIPIEKHKVVLNYIRSEIDRE
jgi:hypothetical protein